MEKLKINPEKDLEELEQYGFKRRYRNCYEYIREIHGKTVYRVYTTPNHGYIQIEILDKEFFINNPIMTTRDFERSDTNGYKELYNNYKCK